jgi:hypothetical protein
MNTHTTIITGKCPHGCPDVYKATFETERLIPVEVIQAAITCYTLAPVYQEDLTERLAECLQCRVTLKGGHGEFVTNSASWRRT